MIKVLLIDDEPLARSVVREYLQHHPQMRIVQECNDGFEGIKAIMQHQPDLIFLDIQMPKINGFEMLELVENPPAVIFTTAYDEHAIRAFETHAVDYLLKPFSRERFDKAVCKWMGQKQVPEQPPAASLIETAALASGQNQRIVVKITGKIKIIPVHEILYLEAADDFVKIHTGEGAFLKNRTMQYFENLLHGQQFIRIHRSYIVSINQVTRLDQHDKDSYQAVLRPGIKLPVSKTGYTRLKTILGL